MSGKGSIDNTRTQLEDRKIGDRHEPLRMGHYRRRYSGSLNDNGKQIYRITTTTTLVTFLLVSALGLQRLSTEYGPAWHDPWLACRSERPPRGVWFLRCC